MQSVFDIPQYGPWMTTTKSDPVLIDLANKHYSRRVPKDSTICRPGKNVVLRTVDGSAVWVTWVTDQPRMDKLEAYECTIFRREPHCPWSASQLIRWAVYATFCEIGKLPKDGLITYVNGDKVQSRNPGFCYLKAEFEKAGRSKKGLILLQTDFQKFIEYEHLQLIKEANEAWSWLRGAEEACDNSGIYECLAWVKQALHGLYHIESLIEKKKVEQWGNYNPPDELDFHLDYYEEIQSYQKMEEWI